MFEIFFQRVKEMVLPFVRNVTINLMTKSGGWNGVRKELGNRRLKIMDAVEKSRAPKNVV